MFPSHCGGCPPGDTLLSDSLRGGGEALASGRWQWGKSKRRTDRQASSGPQRGDCTRLSAAMVFGCRQPCPCRRGSGGGKESCQLGREIWPGRPGGVIRRGGVELQTRCRTSWHPLKACLARLPNARFQPSKVTGYALEVVQPHWRSHRGCRFEDGKTASPGSFSPLCTCAMVLCVLDSSHDLRTGRVILTCFR